VTLSPANPSVAPLSTVQLSAEARDQGNSVVGGLTNASYAWTSSDTTVATVDGNGVVTGLTPGTATITATAPGGAQGSTTVTVTAVGM
jgi:uncharacterized protein YjdB